MAGVPTDHPTRLGDARRLAAVTATGLLDTAPEERFDRLVTLATALLDASFGFFVLVDRERCFWKSCVGVPAEDFHGREDPAETSLARYVIETGKPLLIGDARNDIRTADHPDVCSGKAVAWAGYPVCDESGLVVGSCHVVDGRPRNWSHQDEPILKTFAISVSAEIAHGGPGSPAVAAPYSNASGQRFRVMADTPTVMLWSTSADGEPDYLSQSWLRWRGRPLSSEPGTGWSDGIHPDDRGKASDIWSTAFQARQPFGMEVRFRKADGEYAWVLDSGSPRYDTDGTFVGYLGYRMDIDESRRRKTDAEHTLELLTRQRRIWQRWAHRESALQRVTASLSRALSPDEVARVVVEDAAAVLGASGAVFSLGDPADGNVRLAARAGIMQSTAKSVPVGLGELAADAAARGEPIWLSTPAQWQRYRPNQTDVVSSEQPAAAVSIPLLWSDRRLGVLTVVFVTEQSFGLDDKALTLSMAKRSAEALERARLYSIEHEIAETLQRDLLPRRLPEPDGAALCAQYRASPMPGHVGGDWFESIELSAGLLWLSVGDVVGQGPHAAAVMAQLRSALQGFAMQPGGPAAALSDLNRLAAKIPGALASTAAACLLDIGRRRLRYTCAGHLPPLLLPAAGEGRFLWDGRQPPLGTDFPADLAEGSVDLQPGDTVILYSDGLVERRGELLDAGLERLAKRADPHGRVPPGELCDELLSAMFSDHTPTDDVVLIAVRLDGTGAARRLRRPARAEELSGIRRQVRSWLREIGVAADDLTDITIAVEERAANSVEHAYLGGTPGMVTLTMSLEPGGTLCLEVRDNGRWRDSPAPGNRGRGLDIIRTVMDSVAVNSTAAGTTVRMTFDRGQRKSVRQ